MTGDVGQLTLGEAGTGRRSPLLRRLDALVAPVARDAGALVDDEEAIDMARAVCAAMAEADGGGLTRSQLLARAQGPWSAEALEARIDLFARLGLLQPYLAKAHQQRYVLNPAGMVGLLIVDRVAERGGVDELYVLLDRARTLLDSGTASRADVAEVLVTTRSVLSVYADELARLVDTAPLGELIAERHNHDHARLFDDIGRLNDLVSDAHPDLDAEAYRLVTEAQRYVDACYALIERILDEGGQRRDFSVLAPEEYLAAARQADTEALADVGGDLVWQHAEPWVDPADVDAACTARSGGRRTISRPSEPPPPPPDDDPLTALDERLSAQRRRREFAAEQQLQGEDHRELTSTLRGLPWEAAAALLGDLLALDTDPEAAYHADTGDALFIDPEAAVTYASPLTLNVQRAAPENADSAAPPHAAPAVDEPHARPAVGEPDAATAVGGSLTHPEDGDDHT